MREKQRKDESAADSAAERAARRKRFDEAIRDVVGQLQKPKVRPIKGASRGSASAPRSGPQGPETGANLLPKRSKSAPGTEQICSEPSGRAGQDRGLTRIATNRRTAELILRRVSGRLRKSEGWKKLGRDLLIERFEQIVFPVIRAANRAAGYDDQLPLPGFEGLTGRIRLGRESLPIARTPVPRFFAYVERYELRYDKDRRRAEELRRLANLIRPFAEKAADVGEALAQARAAESPARLRVV